jgi:putative MATE family efflux protein
LCGITPQQSRTLRKPDAAQWKGESKMAKTTDLRKGNIVKGLFEMAIPLMFLNLINSFYNIVDTFFVGQIGELQVGAVSLVNPIMNCAVAFATGLSAAALALIAQAVGASDRNKASEIATHLLTLSLIIGVVMSAVTIFAIDGLLAWLETPQEIYADSRGYLFGISFDFVGMFLLSVFHSICQANGDSKSGVRLNSISAVLNMILDPIFIFVLGMGTFGAAIATSLSKILVLPMMLAQIRHDPKLSCISIREYPLTVQSVREIMVVTIPASVGQFFSAFGFVIMNKAIIYYGSIAMSAYGLGSKIANLFYIPVTTLGGALSAFIGQNLGAGDIPRARECYRRAMMVCCGISVFVTAFGWIFSPHIIPLFVKDASEELLTLANEYTFYSVATAFFMGWYSLLNGVFNGSGHTTSTLFLSVFRLWGCRIPMIYLFRFLGFGPVGIWWSMVLSNLLTCLVGQGMYHTHRWERQRIKKQRA